MNKVTAILTSDWHIRETIPTCRTDDFFATQWEKISFVFNLQVKYNCPIIHAGDLFHHWKPSPYLLTLTMKKIPYQFNTIYGQHDLPQHNLKLQEKCGIYNIYTANTIKLLDGSHWGQEPKKPSMIFNQINNISLERKVLVWHNLTYKKELPFPNCTASSAKSILKKYPQYDLIVTGDNHQTFIEEYKGRLLVNPGSLTRQSAKQIEHKPCVFLWYGETNTVKQIFIPIKEDVISREHIEIKEKRNKRIDAFVLSLDTNWESEVSFKTNLERFCTINKINKEVKELITKFTEK